jgi:hypothetical protein
MGRIVLLVAIVAAISMLVVYAVSSRPEPPIRVPPILQDAKVWARTEPVVFLQ